MNSNNNLNINSNKNDNNNIKQTSIIKNQFKAYQERMTTPASFESNEKKNTPFILPYILIISIIIVIIVIAVLIFLERR